MAFIQWLTIFTSMVLHPFYISMTEINYNDKTKALELSVRIFTDDFEKTLRKNCNCIVDLGTGDKKPMEKIAAGYIQKHLQIRVNGEVKPLEYMGYQREEESTWNFFVIRNVNQVKRLEVNNSLLHDYREEQINMLHIKANGKDQTDKLDYPNKQYTISY